MHHVEKPVARESSEAFSVRRDYIPASDYLDRRTHELEDERLWPKVWQIACREEELPGVGDYVVYDIVKESIVIVRTGEEEFKAFYNVCSHRGRQLCDAPRGHVTSFRCAYHGWRFGLTGNLLGRPSAEDWTGCPNNNPSDLSLLPVKVDRWAGMLWINMDPKSEPLLEYLKPLPEKLDMFEFETNRLAAYWTIRIPVNWKVTLEAFVEAYHAATTHSQLLIYGHSMGPAAIEDQQQQRRHSAHTLVHAHGPSIDSPYKGADYSTVMLAQMEEMHETLGALMMAPMMDAARRANADLPPGSDAAAFGEIMQRYHKEELAKRGVTWPANLKPEDFWSTEWQMFPNSSLLPAVDGALWYRCRPDGDRHDSSIMDIWVLGRYAPGQEPEVEHEFFDRPEDFKNRSPFLEQDFSNLIAVQKGMNSRGFRGARPNPVQEVGVSNLHRVLHQYLYDDDA